MDSEVWPLVDCFTLLELGTQIVTIWVILSGAPVVYRMYKTSSTLGVPLVLFTMAVINALNYYYYGLILNNFTLIFLNMFGAIVQAVYVVVYLLCASYKLKPAVASVSILFYFIFIKYLLGFSAYTEDDVSNFLGISGLIVATAMYLYPAIQIKLSFEKGNTEDFPLPIVLSTFFCATFWLVYGYLLNDAYVWLPNVPGVFLSLIQFYLLLKFGVSKREHID